VVSSRKKGVDVMPTKETRDLVPITADARRVIRDIRGRVGLSRRVLEQRAKLGKGYVKDVELGRTQSAESARFKRLLQVVQREATRGEVPAKVTARVTRALKSAQKPGPKASKK
jgi:ribosome-binding protein aMBF1 (putative translation factor)